MAGTGHCAAAQNFRARSQIRADVVASLRSEAADPIFDEEHA
jgi:hypothetical protein